MTVSLARRAAALAAAATSAFALLTFSAPSAEAATCSGGSCMYWDINGGGSVWTNATGTCGYVANLGSWNDKASSLLNKTGYTQVYYWDANGTGKQLTVSGGIYIPDLRNLGWNDQISSIVWTG